MLLASPTVYKGWEIRPNSSFIPRLGWIPKVDIVQQRGTSLIHNSIAPSDPSIHFQSLEDANRYAVGLGRVAINRQPGRR